MTEFLECPDDAPILDAEFRYCCSKCSIPLIEVAPQGDSKSDHYYCRSCGDGWRADSWGWERVEDEDCDPLGPPTRLRMLLED